MTVSSRSLSVVVVSWLLFSSQAAAAVEIQEIGGGSNQGQVSSPRAASSSSTVSTNQQNQSFTSQTIESSSDRSSNSVLVNLVRQQQELQVVVERLRSENEELNHTIDGLESRLRDMYGDLDRRMQELEKRGVAPAASQSAPAAIAGDSLAESKAYEHAFNLLRNKQYDSAIQSFERFLQTYPSSEFADNAKYWIGEGHYVTRDFKQAANSFTTLISSHPKSSKISDAYLKLGFSQYELKQYTEARKTLGVVTKQYGASTAARLAKERLERMTKEGR